MSRSRAFVLPASARLTIGAGTIAIAHDGDVVLEQTLGRRLARLDARGDVTLREARFGVGVIEATGKVLVEADVDGEEIRGEVVVIGDVEVRARSIVATRRVEIGRARLAVDVIVAPEVHIAPEASGRVRIVDCHNERPPTKVRGCLSLDDYEADFGDVADFLTRRGVAPVSPLPAPRHADEEDEDTAQVEIVRGSARPAVTPIEAAPPESDPPEVPVEVAPEPAAQAAVDEEIDADDAEATVDATDLAAAGRVEVEVPPEALGAVATVEVAPPEDDEGAAVIVVHHAETDASADDDGAAVVVTTELAATDAAGPEDVEELDDEAYVEMIVHEDEPPGPPRPNRRAQQVERAWERMARAYGDDVPRAVAELGRATSEGRAAEIADRVDALWLDTLREHLDRGTPPPRAVTLAFHHVRAARA